jgi:hypothetical protein
MIDIRQNLPCPGGHDLLIAHVYKQKGDEHANARLIAAAPALRDMLAAIVLRWDAEVRDRGESVQFPARAYFEDARALLARIGG